MDGWKNAWMNELTVELAWVRVHGGVFEFQVSDVL